MVTCFVAMPVSVPDEYVDIYSHHAEHFLHVFNHLFTPALKNCEYNIIPPMVSESYFIHFEKKWNLQQSAIVLCGISCLTPNVFF